MGWIICTSISVPEMNYYNYVPEINTFFRATNSKLNYNDVFTRDEQVFKRGKSKKKSHIPGINTWNKYSQKGKGEGGAALPPSNWTLLTPAILEGYWAGGLGQLFHFMRKCNAERPKQGSRRFNSIVKTKYIADLGIVNLWINNNHVLVSLLNLLKDYTILCWSDQCGNFV